MKRTPITEARLTPRQHEVLLHLALGQSAKETGFDLGISPRTVDVHRSQILLVTGCAGMAELARYALYYGLIPLSPPAASVPPSSSVHRPVQKEAR